MKHASYTIDPKTQRYHAHYSTADIYRNFDYSSWVNYTFDALTRALNFSMEEHEAFEKAQSIYQAFQKKAVMEISPNQEHEIIRAIDIGLKKQWGRKTERRLENNGIHSDQVKILRDLIF
jgi:hypothetical protein